MRHWKLLAALAALIGILALLFALGQAVWGVWQGLSRAGEQIGLTDDYVMTGDWDGDLVVFASSIALPQGLTVSGNAALVSNQAVVEAEISGTLSASASQITIGPTGVVHGSADLTGETIRVDGAIDGDVAIQGQSVTLGESSQISGEVRVCASSIVDNRASAAALIPCAPPTPSLVNPLWLQDGAMIGLALFALAAALAGGVLAAVPHVVAPLRMARLDEGLRARPVPRMLTGIVALGLWGIVALLLMALPAGGLLQMAMIVFVGLSLIFGAPLIWAGIALAALWLGRPILRLFRRPKASAPWAALAGGLILSLGLALVGLNSTLGIVALALLAALGLAAISAGRAAGAIGSQTRQTSYFVQG